MSDDRNRRRPEDATRIALDEDYEVEWWTRELKVSREELEAAVAAVGHGAAAVQDHLNRREARART